MRYRNLVPGAMLVAATALAQTAASPNAASAAASANTHTAQQAPAAQQSPTTLNVTTRLVVIPVTLRDSKEHLVRNLTRDDFTLAVDGKPQPIRYFDHEDDLPLTVGLLVDVSGSQRTVLDAERTASSAFLDGMLQPGRDAAFVVQFGQHADLLADVTGSLPKLQAGIQKLDADNTGRPSFNNNGGGNNSGNNGNGSNNDPQDDTSGNNRRGGRGPGGNAGGGGTVLYDAVFLSSDEVLKKAPSARLAGTAPGASTQSQSRKAVVLLTDGDDRGSTESLTASIEAAQRNDVTIYAIYYKGEEQHNNNGGGGRRGGGFPGGFPGGGRGGGFPGGGGGGGRGGGNNPGGGRSNVDGRKILERMADETGGRVFEVTKKLTLPDIYKEIAEELRSQYRLGFTPVNNEDGYHKLVVDTPKQKKLILQARDGYYTGAAPK